MRTVLVARLGVVVIVALLDPKISAGGSERSVPKGELRLSVISSSDAKVAKSSFSLEMKNIGSVPFSIAKPMFPTRWLVKRMYFENQSWKADERRGGKAPGRTSPGHKNRYPDRDYATIRPGESFRITDDLDWYLGPPDSKLLPGRYVVTFYYDYDAKLDESEFHLFGESIESNTIEVSVYEGR